MELRVNHKKKKPKHKDQFEIQIEFMEGDADGEQYEKFFFHKEKLEEPNFKSELEDFLICISTCIEKDKKGRGGFDTERSLMKAYCQIPNWERFAIESFEEYHDDIEDYLELTEEEFEGLWGNKSIFKYSVPRENYGFYTSYSKLKAFFYDENGDKYPVEIIL